MKPILQWKARLVSVKTFPDSHPVSYGARYHTKAEEKIGIVPVGYADGWRRRPHEANCVLLHGTRVPVKGTVCMDQCMVSIPDHINAKLGDEVVLLGRQGDEEITDVEIAEDWWGTNNYDVIANISARVPRIYVR
jgi:alanine racemase